MAALFNRRNQLQWLALLAIAVILPTVSLLWFMSRVIANERLVVREKLAVLYQDKLTDATAKTESLYRNQIAALDKLKPADNPYSVFKHLVLESQSQGVVIWDASGALLYPRTTDALGNSVTANHPLAAAWQLEFAKNEYAGAAELYSQFTTNNAPQVAITALIGKARCLSRLNRLDEAIESCRQAAAFSTGDEDDLATRVAVENARLLLLSLLKQSAQAPSSVHSPTEVFHRTVDSLTEDLYDGKSQRALLPANQNLFIAQKVLAALEGPIPFPDTKAKDQLRQLTTAEETSFTIAELYQPLTGKSDVLFKTTVTSRPSYGLCRRTGSGTMLVLLSDAGLASILSGYREAFAGTESTYRILDSSGDFVAGTAQPQGQPFTVAALPEGFPGWKAELYFQGGDVFEKAAQRQIAVYTWTGLLVILLILIVSAFAVRAVGRQIRLNQMKNDFIATVTHELKTPLASMRVLIETLLEGNVKDETQVTRYLQLTAKENERLSRMIDNFLTFSRMERNKVAFTLTDARPGDIARDAVESVQTKFATHNCRLQTEIPAELPEIQADHDAIVTVLVNLLDNACKYTTDDKRIGLKVSANHDTVCFAVTDNGIGIARRHLRRIFDRFYQVDSSLARKAEGCGLGLSIVKFIIDAHKGDVMVESKPGQGSTFLVRLPIGEKNAD